MSLLGTLFQTGLSLRVFGFCGNGFDGVGFRSGFCREDDPVSGFCPGAEVVEVSPRVNFPLYCAPYTQRASTRLKMTDRRSALGAARRPSARLSPRRSLPEDVTRSTDTLGRAGGD